ncbi:MAG: hypothetical protein HYW06_10800, partial [Gemmatimonadetes bacterium]|nr:hypothetical protein [Gemmatimonadota bacterium]
GVERIDDAGLAAVRKRTKGGANTNLEAIKILQAEGITPMTSLITDPSWDEEDFDRLEQFVRLARLPNPTFTVLPPLPGTELWETDKARVTTDDCAQFDVMHLVMPSRLPPERFYQRFAGLYALADVRAQLGLRALTKLLGMGLRGKGWVVRRVWSAVREMRDPEAYLRYPGTTPKPRFVPAGFGAAAWITGSRSHLAWRSEVTGVH